MNSGGKKLENVKFKYDWRDPEAPVYTHPNVREEEIEEYCWESEEDSDVESGSEEEETEHENVEGTSSAAFTKKATYLMNDGDDDKKPAAEKETDDLKNENTEEEEEMGIGVAKQDVPVIEQTQEKERKKSPEAIDSDGKKEIKKPPAKRNTFGQPR